MFHETAAPKWLVSRLTELAKLRRTRPPAGLESFASALSGFSEQTVDRVCRRIEQREPDKGEPKFPRLGKLLNDCRAVAERENPAEHSTHWTVERYRTCWTFDRFMNDCIVHDQELHAKFPETPVRTRQDFLSAHPTVAAAWSAWTNQKRAGTLHCPGWCDTCEGSHTLVQYENGDAYPYLGKDPEGVAKHKTMNTFAVRCPACRSQS